MPKYKTLKQLIEHQLLVFGLPGWMMQSMTNLHILQVMCVIVTCAIHNPGK